MRRRRPAYRKPVPAAPWPLVDGEPYRTLDQMEGEEFEACLRELERKMAVVARELGQPWGQDALARDPAPLQCPPASGEPAS